MQRQRSRSGMVFLFVLGLLTVMIVFAFGFLRTMQNERGNLFVQRKDDLARLAAEMGMSHAIAVCTQEYLQPTEVRDASTDSAVSRLDGLHKNAFNLLSPRINGTHRPSAWDLAPDVPFADLFSSWCPNYHVSTNRIVNWTSAWRTGRGYGRIIEANRFDYDGSAVYDPSTYDMYTPATPNPAAVKSPFPPVPPWVRGGAYAPANQLDHPLWLDNNCRPVSDPNLARFRLRYAVTIQDQSANLWMNTDMPWLNAGQKSAVRTAYKDAIEAVGSQLGKSVTLESVFLGYGAYQNCRFAHSGDGSGQAAGVPIDFASRGGGAMPYRDPNNRNRAFMNVLGSPTMAWNDPAGTWLGNGLLSWNDIGFATQGPGSEWHLYGDTKDNEGRVRGDQFAQNVVSPFGRPEYGATDHPWVVNVLMIAPRLIQGMVNAYVPPTARSVLIDSETHYPYVSYPDAGGNQISTWTGGSGSYGTYNWNATTWSIPASLGLSMPGQGIDLFTDTFQPGGVKPFNYPAPTNRDYWYSTPASARLTHAGVADTRSNAQRYPGQAFFLTPTETQGNQFVGWWKTTPKPRQLIGDPASTSFAPPSSGVDDTGKYIVFYSDDATNVAKNYPAPADWQASHAYALGNTVANGGKYYVCTHILLGPPVPATGLSAASGGPSGTGSAIPDNQVAWDYYAPPGADTTNILTPNQGLTSSNLPGTFSPGGPFNRMESGPGGDTRCSLYQKGSVTIYTPPVPVPVDGLASTKYPDLPATPADQVTAVTTPPATRNTLPGFGGLNPNSWNIVQTAGGWGNEAKSTAPNSYWLRLSTAFWHAVFTAQTANLAWADPADIRNQKQFSDWPAGGVTYSTVQPGLGPWDWISGTRKGKASWKNASDPKTVDKWDPRYDDFKTMEQIDRQFIANMGESFEHPGQATPAAALTELDASTGRPRPARFSVAISNTADPSVANYGTGCQMYITEYRITNNIRTLLTPIDSTVASAALTARSTDAQTGPGLVPQKLWLLDEQNGEGDPAYTPGTTVGTTPTHLARARAKLMELVLNDWRMSFLGASKEYASAFRPKDFDGDGQVFCSGYMAGASSDADTGLSCFAAADSAGNGPASGLTMFSVTGCLSFMRSNQYRIIVRGELYDNILDKAVSEHYLESDYLIDPDRNVNRLGGPASGIEDSTVMMQRQIHNYYRGYMTRSYP